MLELLIALLLGLALLVAIPVLLLKAVFGLLGFVVVLPFKVLGALVHVAAGMLKLVLGVAGIAVLVVGLPVLVAILPVALMAGCIFIFVKILAAIF